VVVVVTAERVVVVKWGIWPCTGHGDGDARPQNAQEPTCAVVERLLPCGAPSVMLL
jgi:hypothetical protein